MPTYEVTYPGFPTIQVNAGTALVAAQFAPHGLRPAPPQEDIVVQVRHLATTVDVVVRWSLVAWRIPEGLQPADRLPTESQVWEAFAVWPLSLAHAMAMFGYTRRGDRRADLAEAMKATDCDLEKLTDHTTRRRLYSWLCERIDDGDDDFRLPVLRAELLRWHPELRGGA